jgi:hypothetical protein
MIVPPFSAQLKRSQERSEGGPVVRIELWPELMPSDGASLHAKTLETGWGVVLAQASRVKPVFERRHRPAVLERPTVPDTLQ